MRESEPGYEVTVARRAHKGCDGGISVVQPSWRSFPLVVLEQEKKP